MLDGARPEVWVADLFGSQQGHGERGQVCLAHQLREVQYALDAGDAVFAPAMLAWLQRAIKVGRKRERVKDATLQRHRRDLGGRLAQAHANYREAGAARYRERTTVERVFGRLKDEFGGRHLRVRGHGKVACHLMFGVLALTVDQLLRMAH